ncbi:MAG: hypothetical protein IPO13_04030 [Rhodocyclaceae bacterium]|nr:hypothetical protein [Rhodocyclaceae bacterium]
MAFMLRPLFPWQRRLSALLAVPVAIYLITTVALMLPNTGPLTIPVIFYMGIIGLMLWRAAAVANNDPIPVLCVGVHC